MKKDNQEFSIKLTKSEAVLLAYCLAKGLIAAEKDGKSKEEICDFIDKFYEAVMPKN